MNYRLIMLPNPILVSDEQIKRDDRYLSFISWLVYDHDFDTDSGKGLSDSDFKVVAGRTPLPRLDLSLIAGEIGYVDVESLAKANGFDWENTESSARRVFEKWHQSRKYTEQDLRRAVRYGINSAIDYNCSTDYMTKEELGKVAQTEEDFISCLQQPKVYNVEVEMDCTLVGLDLSDKCTPKITNNTIKITKIL